MVAESIPARRRSRLLLALLGGLAAASITAALGAGPAAASGSPAVRAAVDEPGVHLIVAPGSSPLLRPGQQLSATVTIENRAETPLAAGELELVLDREPLQTRSALREWLSGESSRGGDVIGTAAAPALGAGATATVTVSSSGPVELAGAGPFALSARLGVDGVSTAQGRTTVVGPADTAAPVDLALAAPITVPPQTGGLVTAEELETWTGPFGLLSRQLDAVEGRTIAIGIDPRIIASIRVLGGAAPESAVAWLDRLAAVPNEIFPLAYADADLAAQSQLGLDAPLLPLSFDDVLDPARFSAGGEGSTPAAGADGVPSTEALLEWPYTRTDLVWPGAGTVTAGDLEFFANAGLTSSLLAARNVEPPAGPTPNAASTISGSTAVVADGGVNRALAATQAAGSEAEWQAANAVLAAELTLIGQEGRAPTVLGLFARGTVPMTGRLAGTLDLVETLPSVRAASLSQAIGAPPQTRALVDAAEDPGRLAALERVLGLESELEEFSTALTEPEMLLSAQSRAVLGLFSVDWLAADAAEDWPAAVAAYEAAARELLSSVQVAPSSPILVIAGQANLTVTVENTSPYEVSVVVDVDPTNARLVVEDTALATIGPNSRATVSVPVAARVGNGDVELHVSLASPTGVPIGQTVRIPANVQADWEGVGAGILAGLVVLFLAFGVWRSVRRRRREKAETADAAERAPARDPAPDGGGDG